MGKYTAVLAVAVILVLLLLSFNYLHKPEKDFLNSPQISTPSEPPKSGERASSGVKNDESGSTPEEGIRCENCHLNKKRGYVPQADKVKPHTEGGKYCYNCHGSKVHEIHIGEGTINLDCKTCHGVPPKVPDCGGCHGYPDPLKPSNGNLINIHMPRGVYCTKCHAEGFLNIHIGDKAT